MWCNNCFYICWCFEDLVLSVNNIPECAATSVTTKPLTCTWHLCQRKVSVSNSDAYTHLHFSRTDPQSVYPNDPPLQGSDACQYLISTFWLPMFREEGKNTHDSVRDTPCYSCTWSSRAVQNIFKQLITMQKNMTDWNSLYAHKAWPNRLKTLISILTQSRVIFFFPWFISCRTLEWKSDKRIHRPD